MSQSRREPEAEAAGFVLAGGRSSRMGRDKALIPLAGEPLAAHAMRLLKRAGLKATLVGSQPELAQFGPVIVDSGAGPLGGICEGLAAADCELSVFVPVDLPLLPASLIVEMVNDARMTGAAVTLVCVNGFAQTFPAVVDGGMLPALKDALERGNGGCFAAFEAGAARLNRPTRVTPVEMWVQTGKVLHPNGLPAAMWFLNANRPEDLARSETLVAAPHRVS